MSHHSTRQTAGPPARLPRRQLLALLAAAGVLAGCGKRGPLRLPEPAPPDAGATDEETE